MTEDYGQCIRCVHFSPIKPNAYPGAAKVGICHWKWRGLKPTDATPLVNIDSRCEAFEPKYQSAIHCDCPDCLKGAHGF